MMPIRKDFTCDGTCDNWESRTPTDKHRIFDFIFTTYFGTSRKYDVSTFFFCNFVIIPFADTLSATF